MFIGHIAVGFASKRWAPRTSLLWLLAAPMLADLLWPLFLLFGWEHVRLRPSAPHFLTLDLYDYPWSHSLLALMAWATAFSLVYWLGTHYKAGAIVLWIGVVSHWICDWITHQPDMPLWPGSIKVGLGLWNSAAGTVCVELGMLAVGVWLYMRAIKAKDRIGRYGFLVYVAVLVLLYVSDLSSGAPPSVSALIWSSIPFEAVLLIWPWWFDRHRQIVEP